MVLANIIIFLKILFLFIFEREREKKLKWGEGHRQRKRENLKQTPHRAQSPTWGSLPQP